MGLVIEKKRYTNIRCKPWWMLLVPWTGKTTCNALYPYIYLPKHIYDNLRTDHPNPWWISVVLHEAAHIENQKKDGPVKHVFLYLFNSRFRFEEELRASKPQFAYLKKQGLEFDRKRKARQLAGWLYAHCTSYQTALTALDELWHES